MSESDKHRHLVQEYCLGNGCDLGSSGEPIVPHAIQVDLEQSAYRTYNSTRPEAPIHWRGTALDLPFKDGVMDFCHQAHLIEDFADPWPLLRECNRVLKKGGFLIISGPSRIRFRAAVAAGQGDNLSHKKELEEGDLTRYALQMNYEVLFERFVTDNPKEYSLLMVARKR